MPASLNEAELLMQMHVARKKDFVLTDGVVKQYEQAAPEILLMLIDISVKNYIEMAVKILGPLKKGLPGTDAAKLQFMAAPKGQQLAGIQKLLQDLRVIQAGMENTSLSLAERTTAAKKILPAMEQAQETLNVAKKTLLGRAKELVHYHSVADIFKRHDKEKEPMISLLKDLEQNVKLEKENKSATRFGPSGQ